MSGKIFAEKWCNFDALSRYNVHGMPPLLVEPIPPLVHVVEANPYNDPLNPPSDPDKLAGFCGIQWTNNTDPGKIN